MKTLSSIKHSNFIQAMRINVFIPGVQFDDYRISQTDTCPDLHIERIPIYDEVMGRVGQAYQIAYYKPNTDVVTEDLAVKFVVYPDTEEVVAIELIRYQPRRYINLIDDNQSELINCLNRFLFTWLVKLEIAGHGMDFVDGEEAA